MRTKSQNELSIAVYARGIRNIQKTQLEPYEKLIQEELGRLFPSLLKNDENGVVDWSYDIMNCSSDNEVFETLERIRQIQQEQQKNDWTCKYCGKNTYDVDCEYLFGTDHVSCAVENESVTSNNIDGLMSKMSRMQDYITQLESRLSQLETQYEEPTN
jgi:hypothetical protein